LVPFYFGGLTSHSPLVVQVRCSISHTRLHHPFFLPSFLPCAEPSFAVDLFLIFASTMLRYRPGAPLICGYPTFAILGFSPFPPPTFFFFFFLIFASPQVVISRGCFVLQVLTVPFSHPWSASPSFDWARLSPTAFHFFLSPPCPIYSLLRPSIMPTHLFLFEANTNLLTKAGDLQG